MNDYSTPEYNRVDANPAAGTAAWYLDHPDGSTELVKAGSAVEGTRDLVALLASGVAVGPRRCVVTSSQASQIEPISPMPPKVYVPSRPRDYDTWRKKWRAIEDQVRDHVPIPKIAKWLGRMHPDLKTSTKTLGNIANAGIAGALDRPLQVVR